MNRVALLLQTPSVTLQEFDHPDDHVHDDPEHEVSLSDSISFVEDGSFDAVVDDGRWQLTPGTLFLTRRGMPFSVRHTDAVPTDRCLTILYSESAVEDLLRADLPALRPPIARLSARRQYLRHRLRSCVGGDALRFELLAGALFESLAANRQSAPATRDAQVTPLMRRIDRAIELIETEYARALTLGELAATSCRPAPTGAGRGRAAACDPARSRDDTPPPPHRTRRAGDAARLADRRHAPRRVAAAA